MELKPEGLGRADVYVLLGALLQTPDPVLLEALALTPAPPRPANEFGRAWSALVEAAARCRLEALDEFEQLANAPGAVELGDHLGALCEAMAVLVRQQRPLAMQRAFFVEHLAGWSRQGLVTIAATPGTDFYRAVARFAQAFLTLEEQTFALAPPAQASPPRIVTRKPAQPSP